MKTFRQLVEAMLKPKKTQTYAAHKDFGSSEKKVFPRKSPSSSGDEEGE